MATQSLSAQEIIDFYKDQVLAVASDLSDFSEGSMHDIVAGAFSSALNELFELMLSEFQKTFIDTAEGDNLELLAIDHFGDNFARPKSTKSTGVISFSRASTTAGNVTIPIGTVVKTEVDDQGSEQRFKTLAEVIMTGTSVDADIEADVAGIDGNVINGSIIVLESTLTDSSVTVNNTLNMAGGQDKQEDAEYRETIKSLISSLAGATKESIEGAVLALPTIGFASMIETILPVIQYDISGEQIEPGATFFRIPFPQIYVADELGNSSPSLVGQAEAALGPLRACGVKIEVLGAISLALNWTAGITLDAGGPNYATLQDDLTIITDSMEDYINTQIEIGAGFSRTSANNFILNIWGASGTGDITQFNTSSPTADVAVNSNQKLIAGEMVIG